MSKDVYADLAALKAKHKKSKIPKHKVQFPNLACRDEKHALSNNIEIRGGFKRDLINDHKWKRGKQESAATVEEINKKSKRIAVLFNKGAYGYIADGTDPKTLGRK